MKQCKISIRALEESCRAQMSRSVRDAHGLRFVACEFETIRRDWRMRLLHVVRMQADCPALAADMVVACMVHATELDEVLLRTNNGK
jgi:spore coat polysaccharide biosynthesis protein SpsF (cytidylyltransferase family)